MKKAFITILAILFIFSCKKDKDETTLPPGNGSNSLRTTVSGMVLDESNAPLNGVTVTAYGQTASTDQHGVFVLKNINANKDRCVIQFSKSGFFKRSHGFIASANTVNYVRIILLSNTATQSFSSSSGGTISLPDGSSAQFQPNSFVTSNGSAYSGTVNLIVKHLSPDDANFGFTIPGGDLLGKDLNNKDVALYTYGMLGVELTGSSGEALQLANGTSATLTLAIAASQLSSAPATIPLWFFDETTSLWKEEGTATKVGSNYVGTVNHFSWWNCDYPDERASLKGKVIDCEGNGVSNVVVNVNTYFTLTTKQNGEFQNWVPAGLALIVQVLISDNPWLTQNSQLENIPPLPANQTFIVPDLVIGCQTRVAGIVQTCTGQNTNAYVIITGGSNFFTYQYTTNSTFNLVVIPNSQLDLTALSSNTSHHQTITSLSAPNILNVGTILLCDTVTAGINNITINGGPFSNLLLPIDTLPGYAYGFVDFGNMNMILSGSSLPYYNSVTMLDWYIFGDTAGSFSGTLEIYCENTANSEYVDIMSTGTPVFNVTQFDAPGGRIKGNFITSCDMFTDSISFSGTVSGNFDLLRTP